VAGVPLIQHAPKSRCHQSIARLAQALSGRAELAADSPRSSSFLKRLVGR
jgi:MinD-like ATPase involved in chromosome partitioning or flagellar assembly